MPSPRFIALAAVLAVHSVLSAYALRDFGYVGLWRLPFRDSGTIQLFADLTVAMLLVTVWMVRDARTSRVPIARYLVLTVAAGSFGPLLYLLHREWRRPKVARR